MAKKKLISSKNSEKKTTSKASKTHKSVTAELVDDAHRNLETIESQDLDEVPLNPEELNSNETFGLDSTEEYESINPEEDVDLNSIKEIKKTKPSSKLPVVQSGSISSEYDPVEAYLAEIKKYPLITKDEEYRLAVQYREHQDSRAAEQLVTANLRFVVKIAAEYSKFGAKMIDLIQEGNVGLMHAVKEFNPYKGVRLISYAVWWIRGYIQEYLMRQYSMVRIGTTTNQRKLFYRLKKESEKLKAQGFDPSPALLSSRLGVTEKEVEDMTQRMSGRDVSIYQPVDSEGKTTILDFQADESDAVDDLIGHAEELDILKENIEKIYSKLTPKEKYILENRLLADEPMTLQEIGDHYGTTREAVRQIEARLMDKIKKSFFESHES